MKVLELFSGIRATSKALKNKNVEYTSVNVEFDPKVQSVANHIWNTNDKTIDITQFETNEKYDLLVAGFPCQPFSKAGKKLGFDDPRGKLYKEVLRIIKTTNPEYIILENVKGILQEKNKWIVEEIEKELKELGYFVSVQLLNSKNFSRQQRERVFILASKNKEIKPIIGNYKITSDWSDIIDIDTIPWYRETEEYYEENDRYWYKNYDKPKPIQEWNSAYNRVYNPYTNTYFPTLTSSNPVKIGKIENNKLCWRRMNGFEAMRIMGWDIAESEIMGLNNNSVLHCAGNSMVIQMMEAIIEELILNED